MALANCLGPLKPILRPLVHWVRGRRVAPVAAPLPAAPAPPPEPKFKAWTAPPPDLSVLDGLNVPRVTYAELHRRLGGAGPFVWPVPTKSLSAWRMEDDDSPIFRFVYRTRQPQRHLEFGTFQGTGALYCLEESPATVWTINLLEGESWPDGTWAYGSQMAEKEAGHLWRETSSVSSDGLVWCRTDALGFIGRYYREARQSHRVCQIYCDSTRWDTSNYPPGFFDTVLIDGGHAYDIVASDTRKACEVVRPGGVVMWHDYCPDVEALTACTSPRDVVRFVRDHQEWLATQFRDLFWIFPSWILLGIKH